VADISQDAAVVLTTHDQRLSRRLAHNSVFLLGGRPADPRHENIFSAVLSDAEDGRALVRAAGIELGEVEHRLRGRVKISLDSRSMSIVGDHVGEPGRVIQGRITRMAEESDGLRLRVDAGLPLRLMASAEDLRSRGLMVGDEVRVLVPPGAIEVLE
jgi:tungstate transport system ATP-binding protein